MYSVGRDSGSPVFRFINYPDSDVALVGLAWGIDDINGVRHTWFSSIKRIQNDLGTLDIGTSTVF